MSLAQVAGIEANERQDELRTRKIRPVGLGQERGSHKPWSRVWGRWMDSGDPRPYESIYWKIAVGLSFVPGLAWSLIFVYLSLPCRANLANEAS